MQEILSNQFLNYFWDVGLVALDNYQYAILTPTRAQTHRKECNLLQTDLYYERDYHLY